MPIKQISFNNIGETGQEPQFIYINTNDTVAQVTATGYLNKAVASKLPISEKLMAVVTTQTSPSATTSAVNLFNITFSAGNWSLTSNSTPLSLANGQIYVGNAAGVATGVTMSGDATVTNTGVLTVSNGAITKAKLSPTVAPEWIILFANAHLTVGGSAVQTINVSGVNENDLAFAQVLQAGNSAVIVTAETAANQVIVTFSGDPGSATIFNYQVIRPSA